MPEQLLYRVIASLNRNRRAVGTLAHVLLGVEVRQQWRSVLIDHVLTRTVGS